MNSYNWIVNRLKDFSDSPFLIFQERTYLYSDFVDNINRWIKEINKHGIREGESIAFIADYSPNAIFLITALLLNNNIIVPLSRDTKEKHEKFLSVAGVTGYFEFNEGDEWKFFKHSEVSDHPLLNQLRAENDSGIIIFSSGTTGENKGAVLKASRLLDRYKTDKQKKYRTLIFLKLDHIGGINTLFSIMLNGGTIVTSKDRTPKSVCEAIEKYKVELLPTTPSFLNMLIISTIYKEYDLSSIKLITYGTEPMPESTLQAINNIFPMVTCKQTYGLTELGIFSTKSKDSRSRWMKIGGEGIELKVINNILWVRTRSAMLGYLNAPSPFDNEGWYNTGDEVIVDGEYMLILGRESDIINVGGEKVYPSEVESILLEIPNVKEVLVQGKKNPIMGNIVTATFTLEKPEELSEFKKRVTLYCKDRMERYKIPTIITISDKSLVSERFKKKRSIDTVEAVK